MVDIDVNATFEFILDNPPSILIGGGFLLIVVSLLLGVGLPDNYSVTLMFQVGVIILILGIIALPVWLYFEK